jgi:hypothetical protein
MTSVKDYHNLAMELLDQADALAMRGETERSYELLRQSFENERQAALLLRDRSDAEPTRSILFRGAGTLAYRCGLSREAEQMVAYGLSGNPPDEIADELRELYEQVTFAKQTKLRRAETTAESISPSSTEDANEISDEIVFTGVLKAASATRPNQATITIVDSIGKPHKVVVPSGLADIVRPYWDESVIVSAVRAKRYRWIMKEIHIAT